MLETHILNLRRGGSHRNPLRKKSRHLGNKLQRNWKSYKQTLKNGQERDDETIAKIIDTKVHLNMEIDRDEIY
ncbi:reverse transcriptase [Gossypium australe]|uniref:Reverse transcriptase n=1 Tax=Gossypium australe TaxID=47621 RepID=A0A5B6UPE6_9ROSI|nr:reverse transcriptase [Gossypium australe]